AAKAHPNDCAPRSSAMLICHRSSLTHSSIPANYFHTIPRTIPKISQIGMERIMHHKRPVILFKDFCAFLLESARFNLIRMLRCGCLPDEWV
ncbi:MAG: hypothetical protein WCR46_19270, partial [Deltaproteobacteria bacterium]